MAAGPNTEKAIFLAALDKVTPGERHAFLDQECAGDDALRLRIEALLRAADQPDSLLDHPVVEPAAAADSSPDGATRTHADEDRPPAEPDRTGAEAAGDLEL